MEPVSQALGERSTRRATTCTGGGTTGSSLAVSSYPMPAAPLVTCLLGRPWGSFKLHRTKTDMKRFQSTLKDVRCGFSRWVQGFSSYLC